MTEQQTAMLIELSAPLVAEPKSWAELTEEQQEAFRWLLPEPGIGFSDEQRYWLNFWWLPVSAEDVSALNELMPANHRLSARADADGNLWLNSDVLSDAIDGGPWAAIWSTVSTLPLTYRAEESWPSPKEEDES